jgi:hypothetical protein
MLVHFPSRYYGAVPVAELLTWGLVVDARDVQQRAAVGAQGPYLRHARLDGLSYVWKYDVVCVAHFIGDSFDSSKVMMSHVNRP